MRYVIPCEPCAGDFCQVCKGRGLTESDLYDDSSGIGGPDEYDKLEARAVTAERERDRLKKQLDDILGALAAMGEQQ